MKKITILFFLFITLVTHGQITSDDAIEPILNETNATALIQGSTLEGWEVPSAEHWSIENGVIIGDTKGVQLTTPQWLYTELSLADFILTMEVKLTGTGPNSGIYFRAEKINWKGRYEAPSGYEYDLAEGSLNGSIGDYFSRPSFRIRADAELMEQTYNVQDWNRVTLRARGNRLEYWMNGVKIQDYQDEDPNGRREGIIGLQLHDKIVMKAEFRNVYYMDASQQTVKASNPDPAAGSAAIGSDADLSYLIGLDGISANIYLGTDTNALPLVASQDVSTNVVALSELTTVDRLTTYYWRVDTVLADDSVVTGDIWSFTTGTLGEGGLIAHWALDDIDSSTAFDSSGYGFHGTISNATPLAGIKGTALDFNGNSEIILPVSVFAAIDQEITIAMWVYGAENQPIASSVFHALDDSGTRQLNIHLPWSNSKAYWDAGGAANSYDRIYTQASASQFKNGWNHWVFVKSSAGVMSMYHNGSLFLSGTGKNRSITGITQATIGSQGGSVFYSGAVDDVLLYNVALDAQEVASLYNGYAIDMDRSTSWTDWSSTYGLSGEATLPGADLENGGAGDGYDNLAEYALGMHPATDDAGSREWTRAASEGETNWFEYVHYRRLDYAAKQLSYLLVESTNLLDRAISTNAQDQILVGPAEGDYEPVTNRYWGDEPAEFIQLKIHWD